MLNIYMLKQVNPSTPNGLVIFYMMGTLLVKGLISVQHSSMNLAQYGRLKWRPIDVCRVQSVGRRKLRLIVRDLPV